MHLLTSPRRNETEIFAGTSVDPRRLRREISLKGSDVSGRRNSRRSSESRVGICPKRTPGTCSCWRKELLAELRASWRTSIGLATHGRRSSSKGGVTRRRNRRRQNHTRQNHPRQNQ